MADRIVTGFYIKVEDGIVSEVWDMSPGDDEIATGLWSEAIEVYPELIAGREYNVGHTIDITTTPMEIRYNKVAIGVDNRKENLQSDCDRSYSRIAEYETEKTLIGQTPDLSRITAAATWLTDTKAALEACTTHDELEAVDLTPV
mgnify:FL=1